MSLMLCGQHLVLAIIVDQFEDPTIASGLKGQDRRDLPKTPTRPRPVPEVSTGSHTSIIPEDVIVEHTSDPGNANNGEDDDDLTPPLG